VFCEHTLGAQFADKPLILEPWQAFCTWNIFGWRRQETGLRRFRRAYITVAAKAGKTTWMGGMALLLAIADIPAEAGPHVFIVSTKLEQSRLLYDETVKFIEKKTDITKACRVYRAPHRIEFPSIHGLIKPIALGPKIDGINAHAIIRDELHAFTETHREGCEKLPSRMDARQQPLMVDITTAGNDKSQLWRDEDGYASRVVESAVSGQVVDDSYFAFIARMDVGDDPFAESSWRKANPSLGVTVPLSVIQEEATRARIDPTAKNKFLRYKCNVEVSASNVAILPEQWAMGNSPVSHVTWEEGYGGVDLARTRDWAAIAACFPIRNEEGKAVRWELLSRTWIAGNGQTRVDQEPFRSWIRDGKIGVIEGDRIVYDELEAEILRWAAVYSVKKWAFDPNRAAETMNRLWQTGEIDEPFPFIQGTRKYNEPCIRFVDEVSRGNVLHGNDPVLTWQAGNLQFYTDHEGLVKPDKRNERSKIDALVAALMAFSECLFAERENSKGPWFITS
jgi:phage terminase large subunit-like protein